MCTCEICKRLEEIKQGKNNYFVISLQTGDVVLGDHQRFRGYSLFLCHDHIKEVYDLTPEKRALHLFEMSIVAEAVAIVFNAEKMNYESLGNGAPHLHWHLFPRRKDDMPFPGPVWWIGKEEMYDDKWLASPDFLDTYRQKLASTIEELLVKYAATA